MNDLNKLISMCKGSVDIKVNNHKDCYESIPEYLESRLISDEVDDDCLVEMIKNDSMINIHFYPHTPVGFYSVYHHDMDEAIKISIKLIEDE